MENQFNNNNNFLNGYNGFNSENQGFNNAQDFSFNQGQNFNQDFNLYNQQNSTNLNQFKNKKRHGCLFAIIKFFVCVFIIIALIVGIVWGIMKFNQVQKEKKLKEELSQLPIISVEETFKRDLERLKTEDSDLVGLTMYDKLAKGLKAYDGSDSDGDGLTDKEEIEIYHTDPLKKSSSGDNIADGYKVENNLDLNYKYKDSEVNYVPFYSYSNINVKDKSTENSLIYINEIENYKLLGEDTIRVYNISDYVGELEIDFSDDIAINNLTDYVIFKRDNFGNTSYEKLKDKDGKIKVKVNEGGCVVGITKLKNMTFNSLLDTNNISVSSFNDSVIIMFPFTGLFGNMDIYIFEKNVLSNENPKLVNCVRDICKAAGFDENSIGVNIEYKALDDIQYFFLTSICKPLMGDSFYYDVMSQVQKGGLTQEEVSTVRAVMAFFFYYLEVKPNEWADMLKEIKNLKVEDIDEEIELEKPSKYMTTFDLSKDTLPFPNLGTYVSPGGNCAGFSEITAALFNGNLYSKTDSITFDDVVYTYDISDENEFKTFFDKYLYDYKDYGYWKERYGDTTKLARSEYAKEDALFLDFLGAKWAEFNKNQDSDLVWFNDEPKWTEFEKVIKYFENNNKILNLAMKSIDGGHAITAYGLEQDVDNPNIWYVYVYDNNFPNKKYKDKIVDNRMKIVRTSHWFGEDTFEYDYNPIPNMCYRYTSYFKTKKVEEFTDIILNASQVHGIAFYDDNYKLIMG